MKYLLILCLLLCGCSKDIKLGKTYRVMSGPKEDCIGMAVDAWRVSLSDLTVYFSQMTCGNIKLYGVVEKSRNLEEYK